jgi:urease beta subunit
MLRSLLSAVALFVFSAGLMAGEYTGKVKSVDAEKGTITITVKGAGDKTFKVARDAKFSGGNKKVAERLAAEGLKCEIFSAEKKPAVTVTTTGEGDKEEATAVKIGGAKKKDTDKK